jgi:hypothetical protein
MVLKERATGEPQTTQPKPVQPMQFPHTSAGGVSDLVPDTLNGGPSTGVSGQATALTIGTAKGAPKEDPGLGKSAAGT